MTTCKRCGERQASLCLRCQGELEESLMAEADRNIAALRAQVAELLAALEAAADHIRDTEQFGWRVQALLLQLDAALARATEPGD